MVFQHYVLKGFFLNYSIIQIKGFKFCLQIFCSTIYIVNKNVWSVVICIASIIYIMSTLHKMENKYAKEVLIIAP